MDSENRNVFEDVDLFYNVEEKKDDIKVRDIEKWFMEELKKAIPEDMHSIYINENNVLFACESLKFEEFDLKRQTECIYEVTNKGKRSVLSCFDTLTFYTNLTYRNEIQRRRISLDYKTDPAFLRVIEPRTGKYILSNLIKCAVQQQKGLHTYLEHVKKNIFSFPLLEELNRFALSQKLAYRLARQKLWFLMSLAEELKLVDIGKSFKKFKEENLGELNRNVLDKKVTLRYFKTSNKTTQDSITKQNTTKEIQYSTLKQSTSNEITQLDNGKDVSISTQYNNNLSDKFLSVDSLVSGNISYNQMSVGGSTNLSIPNESNHIPFETNSSSLQDPSHSYSVDISSMNSLADFSNSMPSNNQNPIGFTSLHIGEMTTPVRKDPLFETKQVDSFDSNFMKLIDQDPANFLEFDNLMENSKSNFNYSESSQTGWQALQMIKKNKTKVEEPKMRHFVQKNLDKFVKKKQSFAFKNAVSTISVLEAACKLYGKGPKWSNPNKKEFDMANKIKKLVYVKPSKTVRESDLAYHYLMQYASVHQKLNGGVRQEHAVSYGIIELKKPSPNEPVKSYKINTEPWNDDKYSKKWTKLAGAINFTPWIISKFHVPKQYKGVIEDNKEQEKDYDKQNMDSKLEKENKNKDTKEKQDKKKDEDTLQNDVLVHEEDKHIRSFSQGTLDEILDEVNELEDKEQDRIDEIKKVETQDTGKEPQNEEQNKLDENNKVDKTEDVDNMDYDENIQTLDVKVKTEPEELYIESTHTTSTGVDVTDQLTVETHVEGDEELVVEYDDLGKKETPKSFLDLQDMDVDKNEVVVKVVDKVDKEQDKIDEYDKSNKEEISYKFDTLLEANKTEDSSKEPQNEEQNKLDENNKVDNEQDKIDEYDQDYKEYKLQDGTYRFPGPGGKQMKLTELFKYVYDKISKSKQLPECPELMLVNKNKAMVKQELESFSQIGSEVKMSTKRRKVLDDEYLEPMPENYVKITNNKNKIEVKQILSDSEDDDMDVDKNEVVVKVVDMVDKEKEERIDESNKVEDNKEQEKVYDKQNMDSKLEKENKNKDTKEKQDKKKDEDKNKKSKLSKKERIMRMREIMKSMIEYEAVESEDENLSDPEEIKRSLELLKDKLMNPSESESEIESETEIAKEMKDFIGEVEINEEDEEIARQRFYEDLRIQEEAELAKLMTFKEKGEKELTRREERLKLLMKLKNAKKTDEFHLSDFESSDEELGINRKNRVKVTREDIDRLLRFKKEQKEMSKEEQLEQFIDYKLTEANIKVPKVDEVTVSTNYIDVSRTTTEHDSVTKIKNRRDMVDNMFNEGFDSIFSNIDQYRSDSSLTVNPFGTPNRILDKMDNSSSKSPKKPALVMKSFRWDHSQAKPGNTTTVEEVNSEAPEEPKGVNEEYEEDSEYNLKVLSVVVKETSATVKDVGISIFSLADHSISVCEIIDNEYFTNLESLILQTNPSISLIGIQKDSADYNRIKYVISVCKLACKYKFMNNKDINEVDDFKVTNSLEFLLSKDDSIKNHTKELSLKLAMKAFCLITDLINYHDRGFKAHFTFSLYTMNNYLCMDRAAFSSLCILPLNTANYKVSLYELLNKCRTPIGSQLLKTWISQPLVDIDRIIKRQNVVEAFKPMYRSIQAECLRKVPNLDSILMKFKNYHMGIDAKSHRQPNIEDLVSLYRCVIAANRLNEFTFKRYRGVHSDTIKELFVVPLSDISIKFENYMRLIEKAIDLEEAKNRNFVFKRDVHDSLKKLNIKLDSIKSEIEKHKLVIQNELPYVSSKKSNLIKTVDCNNMVFLFRVPKKEQTSLQWLDLPGITIEKVRLNKNEFLFTTPKLRKYCSDYTNILSQYQECERILLKRIFKVACAYWELVERLVHVLAAIDVLAAFAEVAVIFKFKRAEIDPTGQTVDLVEARHPLVEYVLSSQSFIPNDLYMDRDNSRVHITTGPNMGGKSTYIKQVGLIAIMNQIGSFVPCTSATLPIFRHILCRIGASDIQLRGVSTFLAEMVESSAILKMADRDSLVIIDELGRGTSTHDGFGLSWAIVVDLIERARCFCLCATHFHEMGSLAQGNLFFFKCYLEYSGVVNKHLTAQFFEATGTMTFLYKIKDGVCKKSFGINVAIIAKFPQDVIDTAQRILDELELKYKNPNNDDLNRLFKCETFEEFENNIHTLALET